jgi:hypothetical protein
MSGNTLAEMSARQQAKPRVVDIIEQRATAVALRREGKTYRRIAQIMGGSTSNVHQLVTRALAERRRELAESVDDIRDIEAERLDKLWRVLDARLMSATNKDPEKTVLAMLQVSRQRANLFGLNAPKEHRFLPGGMGVPAAAGDGGIDLSKLSTDDLRELAAMREKYDLLAGKSPALPPGEPVAIVPQPEG